MAASITLNTGASIPAFGLGTWQSPKGAVGNAVEIAIRAGYRHIDCAHLYQNEDEIGEVLQKLFKEGVVKREELFITSKLSSLYMSSKDDVMEGFTETLTNLQLDYIDLYLIHGPFAAKKGTSFANLSEGLLGYDPTRIANVWEALEELAAKGLAKAIGVSNFSITKIETLLKTAKVVPAVNQVECHPYLQQPKLQQYCKSKGIAFEAYSPLGSPARFNAKPGDPVVMDDPVVKEIASKHGVSPAQVCIAFLLQSGLIVIPKSVTESRIIENFKGTELVLTDEEMQKMKAMDKNCRLLSFQWFAPDKTVDQIWNTSEDEAFVLK